MPGEESNPSLDARFRAREIEKFNEALEHQTTADKILGLLADDPIVVELKPGVSMEFYPPSDEQYIDLLCIRGNAEDYSKTLKKSGVSESISDEEAEEKSSEIWGMVRQARDMLSSINGILAELSVDKSFTTEQFKKLSMHYKQKIITEISADRNKSLESARKFRKKPKR